jgi:hypothetical protein
MEIKISFLKSGDQKTWETLFFFKSPFSTKKKQKKKRKKNAHFWQKFLPEENPESELAVAFFAHFLVNRSSTKLCSSSPMSFLPLPLQRDH